MIVTPSHPYIGNTNELGYHVPRDRRAWVWTRSTTTRTNRSGRDGWTLRRSDEEDVMEGDGDGSRKGGDVPDPSNTSGALWCSW